MTCQFLIPQPLPTHTVDAVDGNKVEPEIPEGYMGAGRPSAGDAADDSGNGENRPRDLRSRCRASKRMSARREAPKRAARRGLRTTDRRL